jgi:hypothetical protein
MLVFSLTNVEKELCTSVCVWGGGIILLNKISLNI